MRNFDAWLNTFVKNIYDYGFYIDFNTVYKNAARFEYEYNLLNVLIGKPNQEEEFQRLVETYPSVLKAVPSLIAVREAEIDATDEKGHFQYNFEQMNLPIKQYVYFMRKTGLFDLLQNHIVRSVPDYVLGVETGLNTNARKNRGGDLMENVVERHLENIGLKKDKDFFKEMYAEDVEKRFGIDLSALTNNGEATKRFDFVVCLNDKVFGIEANSYGSGGSKLNETARSYKEIAIESQSIDRFTFVWITDGYGWRAAKNNLKETFDFLPTIYNINDLSEGALISLFGIKLKDN